MMQRVNLAGVPVDLLELDEAVERIAGRAARGGESPPLSVVSANLDHLAQFGTGGRWYGTLDYRLGGWEPGDEGVSGSYVAGGPDPDWLTLLDGAPLAAEAS